MQIDVPSFKGEAPKLAPKALPIDMSQNSANSRLLSTELGTWNGFVSSTTQALLPGALSIYYLDDQLWLTFAPVGGGGAGPTAALTNIWNSAPSALPFGTGNLVRGGNALYPIIFSDVGYIQIIDRAFYSSSAIVAPGDGLCYNVDLNTGALDSTVAQSVPQAAVPIGPNFSGTNFTTGVNTGCFWVQTHPSGNNAVACVTSTNGLTSLASGVNGFPAALLVNPTTGATLVDLLTYCVAPTGASSWTVSTIGCADSVHVLIILMNGTAWSIQLLAVSSSSTVSVVWQVQQTVGGSGTFASLCNIQGSSFVANQGGNQLGMLESDLQHVWMCGQSSNQGFVCCSVSSISGLTDLFPPFGGTPYTHYPVPALSGSSNEYMAMYADNGYCYFVIGQNVSAWQRYAHSGNAILNPGVLEADIAKANIGGDTSYRTYYCGSDAPRFTDLGLASGLTLGGNPVTGSSTVAANPGPYPIYSRKIGVPNPILPITNPGLVPVAASSIATSFTETFDNAQSWNLVENPGYANTSIILTGGDPGACLNTRAISNGYAYGWKSFGLDNTKPINLKVNFAYQRNANDYLQNSTVFFFVSLDSGADGTMIGINTNATGLTLTSYAINAGMIGSAIQTFGIASGSVPGWQTSDPDTHWYGCFLAGQWYSASLVVTPNTPTSTSTVVLTVKEPNGTTIFSQSFANCPNSGPGFGFGTNQIGGFGFPNWSEINYDNVLISGSQAAPSTASLEATTYLYTLVNDLGEESGPSPAMVTPDGTGTITRPFGQAVLITLPATLALTGVDQTYFEVSNGFLPLSQIPPNATIPSPSMNLYRAVTGSNGTTLLLVAANVAFGENLVIGPTGSTSTTGNPTTTVTDSLPDSALSEAMVSQLWAPPPVGMLGILALPNGIYAGFVGNILCLSAQGVAHAWPLEYQLVFDWNIVGIQNIDSTVVVCTLNFPYLCSGQTPDVYSQTKASYPYACASKKSIQFIQNIGVVFATFEGLVAIAGPGQERVLTRDLFTKREWEALNPASMISAVSDNRYFCWYDATSIGGTKGGFYLDLQPQSPYPGIPSVVSGKVSLGFHATARYNDPLSDNLYLILDADNVP